MAAEVIINTISLRILYMKLKIECSMTLKAAAGAGHASYTGGAAALHALDAATASVVAWPIAALRASRQGLHMWHDFRRSGCWCWCCCCWVCRSPTRPTGRSWELIRYGHESSVYESHCGRNVKRQSGNYLPPESYLGNIREKTFLLRGCYCPALCPNAALSSLSQSFQPRRGCTICLFEQFTVRRRCSLRTNNKERLSTV